jgi:hypothetical protein
MEFSYGPALRVASSKGKEMKVFRNSGEIY